MCLLGCLRWGNLSFYPYFHQSSFISVLVGFIRGDGERDPIITEKNLTTTDMHQSIEPWSRSQSRGLDHRSYFKGVLRAMKRLRFDSFTSYQVLLPQLHGCWQKTQVFWVRDKGPSNSNQHVLCKFSKSWFQHGNRKIPAHAVGCLTGAEPWTWETWTCYSGQ